MRSCSETCWLATDLCVELVRGTAGTTLRISFRHDVGVVEGNEGMEQPAVATSAAGTQRGGDRRHAQVPTTIAAHEPDGPRAPKSPTYSATAMRTTDTTTNTPVRTSMTNTCAHLLPT